MFDVLPNDGVVRSGSKHDIQELFSVLFDALERSDPARFKDITGLWQGKALQFIQPIELTDPSQRHVRTESFIDLQVTVFLTDAITRFQDQQGSSCLPSN